MQILFTIHYVSLSYIHHLLFSVYHSFIASFFHHLNFIVFMKHTILTLALLSSFLVAFAQQNTLVLPTLQKYVNKVYVGTISADIVQNYLQQHLTNLQNPQSSLQLQQTQQSPLGTYYTFVQLYNGTPIYGTSIKATINKSAYLVLIMDNTFDVSLLKHPPATNNTRQANAIANSFLNNRNEALDSAQMVICFTSSTKAIEAVVLKAHPLHQADANEYILDTNGTLLQTRNLSRYHHQHQTSTIVDVAAKVFIPDPLTSAQMVYGQNGKYRDNNNADAPELTNQLKDVTIPVTFEGGYYQLRTDYLEIADFDSPNIAPAQSDVPAFNYTRSQEGFEDVNAYYHINTYRNYVSLLGFSNMVAKKLFVDTHALSGQDQSMYVYYNNTPHLSFGEGGVDDAEDADVIIHEFTHYLSDAACESCNVDNSQTGIERSALDEALCDYVGTSYSRGINDFNWADMFSWDGHNQYWNGRDMDTDKHYPEDVATSIYQTSEIFSSALMDVWESLGQQTTDQLVLASLYNFVQGTGFRDAADILMLSDQELFNGAHQDSLYKYLSARGLMSYEKPNAGADTTVCLGATLTLGNNIRIPANAQFFWTPSISLDNATLAKPIANPDRTTYYVAHLINPDTKIEYTDSVKVTVNYCLDSLATDIKLLNTDRFLKGRGDIVVQIPNNTANAQLTLFDATGRTTKQLSYENPNTYLFVNGDGLPAGVYLLKVRADSNEKIFKVIKAK